jgi:hypothetical protein
MSGEAVFYDGRAIRAADHHRAPGDAIGVGSVRRYAQQRCLPAKLATGSLQKSRSWFAPRGSHRDRSARTHRVASAGNLKVVMAERTQASSHFLTHGIVESGTSNQWAARGRTDAAIQRLLRELARQVPKPRLCTASAKRLWAAAQAYWFETSGFHLAR